VAVGVSLEGSMLNTKLLGSGMALAVGVLVVTATNVSARGDGWELVQLPTDAVAFCGSTTVHVSWPVNQEYVRNLPQADGTVIQQFNGYLVVNFATDAGGSVTLNTSGPARSIAYPNGDYEVHGVGLNTGSWTPEQAAAVGMPQVWVSSGLIDFIAHPDGTVTPVVIPHNVTDVCAELGV
jgi:hypothetical protein